MDSGNANQRNPRYSRTVVARGKRVWRKLRQVYGSRFISAYGVEPSPEWLDVLERMTPSEYTNAVEACAQLSPEEPPAPKTFECLASQRAVTVPAAPRVVDHGHRKPESYRERCRRLKRGEQAIREMRRRAGLASIHKHPDPLSSNRGQDE